MFPIPSETAESLYARANLQRGLNNYDQALRLYDQALKQDPNHYPSLCAAGQVLAAQGDFSACEQVLAKATTLSKDDATAYLPLISLSRLSKNRDWAKQLNQGINKLRISSEDKKRLRMQLKGTPSKPDLALAKAAYEAAAQASAHHNTIGCISELLNAVRLGPDNPEAIKNLTASLIALGRITQAKAIARKFCDTYPRQPLYWRLLANAANLEQNSELTQTAYEQIVHLVPTDTTALCALAVAKLSNGDIDGAQQDLSSVEQLGHDGPEYILAQIKFMMLRGNLDQARDLAVANVARFADSIQFLSAYCELAKVDINSDIFSRIKDAATSPNATSMERANILRTLGRSYEGARNYSDAYNAYAQANQIIWDSYDNHDSLNIDESKLWHTFYNVSNWPEALAPTDKITPLFIFGMPRSGTTLTEQIIASHSQVTSIGESGILSNSCQDFLGQHNIHTIADFTPETLSELRDIATMQFIDVAQGRPYVADKTLPSYYLLPLAKLLYPNAAFIHVHRDPRDNLWSVFKSRFSGYDHMYSYDQTALGLQYNRYRSFIDYLRQDYKTDFMDQGYEDLVADQEKHSRALVAHCGLEWEDACLEFYNNKNTVRTLSMAQVRKPIYTSSLQVWRHYQTELQPLFDILKEAGNYPSDD